MFYKYEFSSEKQANEYIDKLTGKDCAVVKLGFVVITPNTFTKGGKPRKDAVISKKYSVDVLWNMPEDKDWTSYRIKLGDRKSSHNFAGVKYFE